MFSYKSSHPLFHPQKSPASQQKTDIQVGRIYINTIQDTLTISLHCFYTDMVCSSPCLVAETILHLILTIVRGDRFQAKRMARSGFQRHLPRRRLKSLDLGLAYFSSRLLHLTFDFNRAKNPAGMKFDDHGGPLHQGVPHQSLCFSCERPWRLFERLGLVWQSLCDNWPLVFTAIKDVAES